MIAATANTNIAFIKYWGKFAGPRGRELNLPAVGSLSMTLADIGTRTVVDFADADRFILNGVAQQGEAHDKAFRFIDLVAQVANPKERVKRRSVLIDSHNSVPTAAGLASSASAFAALALAASRLFGLELSPSDLSGLARRGSASAARSVFGGFVELPASRQGEEVFANQVAGEDSWNVRLVVAMTSERAKDVSSRAGMQHVAETSTYYPAWQAGWEQDFTVGRTGLLAHDLERLGLAMEHSTLAMHATTMAAQPPFMYWNGATLECLHALWALRKAGTPAYFTADAGPHCKALCLANDAPAVARTLAAVPGVIGTAIHRAGKGVTLS